MPQSAHPARQGRQATRNRPSFFTPVKVRARCDGWTPEVQCAFLAELYFTGAVSIAAGKVRRSRESAYRLRARKGAEGFANAWDRVLAGPSEPGGMSPHRRHKRDWRKVTLEQLIWMSEIGLWRPVIYRGKLRAVAHKPDNSALLRLLRRSGSFAFEAGNAI